MARTTPMTRNGDTVTVVEHPTSYEVIDSRGRIVKSGPTGDGSGAVGEIINRNNDGWDTVYPRQS